MVSAVSACSRLAASIHWGLGKRLKSVFLRTSLLSLILIWPAVGLGQQTLEANTGNNFRGWTFKAIPDVSQAGEAPITGIADPLGGSASLNFTLSGEMGNKRVVKLRQQDFAAAGFDACFSK